VKGIDIRTVGSGNVGATNVGRLLGFRYFALVFALDLLKGLGPTLGLPWLVARAGGHEVAGLPVLVALAAILGHNFPVYLRFRGGKGVATSAGAFLALDPLAMLVAIVAFVVFLLVTRYVSMSSVLAGLVFAAAHFARVESFWGPRERLMSLLTVALIILLIVRHRSNFARIATGTEPKVLLRTRRDSRPAGKAGLILCGLTMMGTATVWAYHRFARPSVLDCGAITLTATARIGTGHQRAERLTFAAEGRLLAVSCPRYNRVVLYQVTEGPALVKSRELVLEGRPVALWATHDRLWILQRPAADARHLEEGWCEAFDFQGHPLGPRFRAGFDPDDLVITRDGRFALVLNSGNAEGEWNRPDPALLIIALNPDQSSPRIRSWLIFDHPRDDPARLALRASGDAAAVSLQGSDEVAIIDLKDFDHPRLKARCAFPPPGAPGPLRYGADGTLLVADDEGQALWAVGSGTGSASMIRVAEGLRETAELPSPSGVPWTVGLNPRGSCLEVFREGRSVGALPLRGPGNLGKVRPMDLAAASVPGSPSLLAVADRSGGVRLIVASQHTENGFDNPERGFRQ
jgi:acyl-phosphate glycerol 3-phosphate acyltransferase